MNLIVIVMIYIVILTVNIVFCAPSGRVPETRVFGLSLTHFKQTQRMRALVVVGESPILKSVYLLSSLCLNLEESVRVLHTLGLAFILGFSNGTPCPWL